VALHFTQALARALGDEIIAFTDSVGLLLHQRSAPRRLEIRVDRADDLGGPIVVGTGALAGTLLPQSFRGAPVVGATANRTPISLDAAVVANSTLEPLTTAGEAGRAILFRSMSLVLLEAARRIAPDGPLIRMGPIFEEAGRLFIAEGAIADDPPAAFATRLESEMRSLIREDLPMRDEVWSVDEARAELTDNGAPDAAGLIAHAREATTTITQCGRTHAINMGVPVLPRTSHLKQLLPFRIDVDASASQRYFLRLDNLGATGAASSRKARFDGDMPEARARWMRVLGIRNVGEYNHYCVGSGGQLVPELIRVAEGFHEKWIGEIADRICRQQSRAIAIAGPSSSGKTTFIKRLIVQLRINGRRPVPISLDDYYVDRKRTVRDEDGGYDFEAFEAIDARLLADHLQRLLKGEEVATARYDFVTGTSKPSGGAVLRLCEPSDVLVIEGIHGLHPALATMLSDGRDGTTTTATYRIFVHPADTISFDRLNTLAPEDVRLLRRIVRDRHQRNYPAAETILRWASVRRGELLHIFPHQDNADVIFDSSLAYEISVLKTYAERYLLEVPASHPAFTTAYRLRKLIDQFVAIHPDHVPPGSVLREVIGGSGFDY